jgi:hypothetical protein
MVKQSSIVKTDTMTSSRHRGYWTNSPKTRFRNRKDRRLQEQAVDWLSTRETFTQT